MFVPEPLQQALKFRINAKPIEVRMYSQENRPGIPLVARLLKPFQREMTLV
jgi:hypothetical protein